MMNSIIALGYGIVIFAIVIGVGAIILYNFGGSVGCENLYTFNSATGLCVENANASNSVSPSGTVYTNVNYMNTQLGQSGLAGWTPAVIAVSVGLLFLGMFAIGKGRKGRY